MPEKIIQPIPCSHCGELFAPRSRGQMHEFRAGRNVYHSPECRKAGRSQTMTGRHTLEERFLKHVKRLPNGCLEWTGSVTDRGYGRLWLDGKTRLAHHVAFFLKYGYWPPKGFEIDHVCHPNTCMLGVKCPHRRCANWEHLKLVLRHTENNSRERSASHNRKKTVCINGHEFTDDNAYWWRGKRFCRECSRIGCQKYRLRKRLQSTTAAVLITSPPV